jgi:hypothetical protein
MIGITMPPTLPNCCSKAGTRITLELSRSTAALIYGNDLQLLRPERLGVREHSRAQVVVNPQTNQSTITETKRLPPKPLTIHLRLTFFNGVKSYGCN